MLRSISPTAPWSAPEMVLWLLGPRSSEGCGELEFARVYTSVGSFWLQSDLGDLPRGWWAVGGVVMRMGVSIWGQTRSNGYRRKSAIIIIIVLLRVLHVASKIVGRTCKLNTYLGMYAFLIVYQRRYCKGRQSACAYHTSLYADRFPSPCCLRVA